MVLASTSGTIGVSKDEVILDERAPYADEIVAGWPYYVSKIYQEKLAFDLGAAPRHRGRRGQPEPAARARRSPAVVDRRRAQVHQARDPGRPRRRRQLRRRARRGAATAAALEQRPRRRALPARRAELDDEGVLRPPRPRRERARRRASSCREACNSAARRSSRSSTAGATKSRRSSASPSRWREHYWWSDSGKAERELGFSPRDPQLTLVDTVGYLRRGVEAD